MKQTTAILIGAGLRGRTYTQYALRHPEWMKVVAVAEPLDDRRNSIKELHSLDDANCYTDWNDILARPKFADVAVICTMDRDHFGPAMKAIELGYDILLEKPISPVPEECAAIARAAEEKGVRVIICHVLRFTPFFIGLKNVIDSGRLGKLCAINHNEFVGNVHQSHSFVRGNWGNSDESSPMILQKSCHDMDILQWLIGKKCVRVSSFGGLYHFNEQNKPEGAPERCIDGCPVGDSCYYNAVKLYLEDKDNSWFRCSSTKLINPTDADVERALRETQYGKCVFGCNNNVVDRQVVNLEFEDGINVAFSMSAFNQGGRTIKIMGTKAELTAEMCNNWFEIYDFDTRTTEKVSIDSVADQTIVGGHGGGDEGIMSAFCQMMSDEYTGKSICTIGESSNNHMIAFAAERSRVEGRVVNMDEYASLIV